MRFQLTAVLLLLNLALAGVVVFIQQREADLAERRESRLVVPTGVSDLERITLEAAPGAPDARGWTLVRGRGGWSLESPVAWPANEHAVSRLLTTLEFLEKESSFGVDEAVSSGRPLADYGLDPPLLRLVLTKTGGRETRLGLGRPSRGAEGRLYLLDDALGEISAVGPELGAALATPLSDLRSAEVFRIPRFEVRSLGLQLGGNGNLRVRFERAGDQWSLVAPIQAAADSQAFEQALGRLLALRVEAFLASPPETQGAPAMQVTVEGGGRRDTLVVLGPGPEATGGRGATYLARFEDSDAVFAVAAAPLDALADAQERLRERRFVGVDPDQLRGIVIRTPSRTVTLKRLEDGTRWQVVQQGADGVVPRDAEQETVDDLVRTLANLEASAFVSDAPSASDLARMGLGDTATVITLEGRAARELRLGDAVEGRPVITAMMAGEPFVYEVPATVLGRIKTRSLDYRRRVTGELPSAARLARIRIVPVGGGEAVLDVDPASPPEEWGEGRRASLATLAAAARAFPVRSFLGRGVEEGGVDLGDRVEPWSWEIQVEALLPAGEQEVARSSRFLLTRRLGGMTQFGADPEAGLTFLLTDALIDACFSFTEDRPPPALPPPVIDADPESAARPGRTGDGTGLPDGIPAPRPPSTPPAEPGAADTP